MRRPAFLRPLPPGLRRLLPALLVLAAAAELFAYAGYGAVSRRIAADTLALSARVQDEEAPLRRWLRELNVVPAPEAARDLDGRAFLNQVDEAATASGVRITRLTPHPHQESVLDVELAASFPQFLRFATELELLHGAFHGLQIRPADDAGKASDRHVVSFTLEMPPHSVPLGSRAEAARAVAADPGLRNPFSPAAAPGDGGGDLSQRHHLTGITRIGAAVMATIDGRDYKVGDVLDNMKVTEVGENSVQLAAGSRRYTLHFALK
ncbi:MAG: hypothetical protein JO264_17930 [Acidisphaera sp.]|nr:hypothetical protein [Acidisphaera sp.]